MENLFTLLFLVSFTGLIIGLIKPGLVIRWGNKKTRGRVGALYGLASVIFLTLFGAVSPSNQEGTSGNDSQIANQQSKTTTSQPDQSDSKTVQGTPVDTPSNFSYEILDEEIYDAPVKTQLTQKVLVSGEISENRLRDLLSQLFNSSKSKSGFKYHDKLTNTYIYAFSSKERADLGLSEWIAMLQKGPTDSNPQILINERQLTQLNVQPENKFGLSEKERKAVWNELVLIEYRVSDEAEAQYPLDPTQFLGVGQQFELTEKTPLMPELNPVNSAELIGKIKQLPSRSTITVLKVEKHPTTQTKWYFVEARRENGATVGSGWINSIALINQAKIDGMEQIKKQGQLMESLTDEYEGGLASKYGIDQNQLEEISVEGIEKAWPMPRRP